MYSVEIFFLSENVGQLGNAKDCSSSLRKISANVEVEAKTGLSSTLILDSWSALCQFGLQCDVNG